jgi:hypothetical protein
MSRPIEEMTEREGLNISVWCIWFCGWICYLGRTNNSRLLLKKSRKGNLQSSPRRRPNHSQEWIAIRDPTHRIATNMHAHGQVETGRFRLPRCNVVMIVCAMSWVVNGLESAARQRRDSRSRVSKGECKMSGSPCIVHSLDVFVVDLWLSSFSHRRHPSVFHQSMTHFSSSIYSCVFSSIFFFCFFNSPSAILGLKTRCFCEDGIVSVFSANICNYISKVFGRTHEECTFLAMMAFIS